MTRPSRLPRDPAAAGPYIGRHRPDTVRRVSASWMPPTAARRIGAITTDTILMEAVA